MVTVRPMHLTDYDAVMTLMQQTPGVSLRETDSFEGTSRYLARNPGLSFVALVDDAIVGCVMSGHDGRRGYLQHLLVLPAHRKQGIATALVEHCLATLASLGIMKTHIDVLKTNVTGQAFWQLQGWMRRDDIERYSFIHGGRSNA